MSNDLSLREKDTVQTMIDDSIDDVLSDEVQEMIDDAISALKAELSGEIDDLERDIDDLQARLDYLED